MCCRKDRQEGESYPAGPSFYRPLSHGQGLLISASQGRLVNRRSAYQQWPLSREFDTNNVKNLIDWAVLSLGPIIVECHPYSPAI